MPPLQAAYDAFGGSISADDQQLSTDIKALNSSAFVTNADGSVSVYTFSASAPVFTVITAQPAT